MNFKEVQNNKQLLEFFKENKMKQKISVSDLMEFMLLYKKNSTSLNSVELDYLTLHMMILNQFDSRKIQEKYPKISVEKLDVIRFEPYKDTLLEYQNNIVKIERDYKKKALKKSIVSLAILSVTFLIANTFLKTNPLFFVPVFVLMAIYEFLRIQNSFSKNGARDILSESIDQVNPKLVNILTKYFH